MAGVQKLNKAQEEDVNHQDGPQIVLAGAGEVSSNSHGKRTV